MSRIITNTRIKKIVRGYNLAIGEKRGIVTHILLEKQPIFVGTQKFTIISFVKLREDEAAALVVVFYCTVIL